VRLISQQPAYVHRHIAVFAMSPCALWCAQAEDTVLRYARVAWRGRKQLAGARDAAPSAADERSGDNRSSKERHARHHAASARCSPFHDTRDE